MKTKGKCILIVDDEPPIQRILRRNLTMSGYEVLVADNGEQALELVHLHEPDLILPVSYTHLTLPTIYSV